MAAPIRIAATKTFQREKWLYVPTIANINSPTVTEVNAASGLDISCYLHSDTTRPTQNTNRVQLARRLCDGAQYEQIGTTTYAGGDLKYAVNPQAAAASDGKKAYEKFPEGTTGFLVRRLGKAVATDVAAGDFLDIFPVEFGPGMPMPSSDGEEQEAVIMQAFAVTGPPAFMKAAA